MPYIGPDTIDLVIREDVPEVDPVTHEVLPQFDDHGRPTRTERTVSKRNCSLTVATATEVVGVAENRDNGMVVHYSAKAMLPFDADTVALTAVCAIRHDGRTYELVADAIPKRTLGGRPDHVRVYGTAEVATLERGEKVIITPTFGRDGTGQPEPLGAAVTVIARSVSPGNTTRQVGDDGELDAADFTVAFDLDVAVKDGDRITVRGRTGYARVMDNLEEWAGRSTRVVLVRSRLGGRR